MYVAGMDIEYVDIVTVEFMSPIYVANIVLRYWLIRFSMVKEGDEGYRYIIQLRETFYEGMQESLTISTNLISLECGCMGSYST